MDRPGCVVNVWDLPGEKRPRFTPGPAIGAVVRNAGDAAGLTHMGAHLRVVEPGMAGTNRHFHTVEEEPGEALTYLKGGEIDADDVVTYPEAGVRRVRGRLEGCSE